MAETTEQVVGNPSFDGTQPDNAAESFETENRAERQEAYSPDAGSVPTGMEGFDEMAPDELANEMAVAPQPPPSTRCMVDLQKRFVWDFFMMFLIIYSVRNRHVA